MPRPKPTTATGRPLADFACPQKDCSAYGQRGGKNLRFNGFSGSSRTYRMIQCTVCLHSFSELKGTAFERTHLGLERATAVLEHLQEGCGTRQTGRLTHTNKNTVTRLIRMAGQQAYDAHDELVGLSPPHPRGPVRREVVLRPHQGRAPPRRRAQPKRAR
jgi:LacI family transcriptional regulator